MKAFRKALTHILTATLLASNFVPHIAKADSDSEYAFIDLGAYANCIAFDSEFSTASKYTIPAYMGLGRDSNTQDLKHIYNKNAFDAKKDSRGLIHSASGIPFSVSTSTTESNTILLGKGSYVNKTTVTVDVPNGNYNSFSFMMDTLYKVEASYFKLKVNYTDGTSTLDPDWDIYPKHYTAATVLEYDSTSSYIDFTRSANDPLHTGMIYRLEAADPTVPDKSNYYLPVYTLSTSPLKTVESITIEQNSDWRVINIFAISGDVVTTSEEATALFDVLPDANAVNECNFVDYRSVLSSIQSLIDSGATLSQSQHDRYTTVKSAYTAFVNEFGLVKRFFVATDGNANNLGTKSAPFDSLDTARKQVRQYKAENPDVAVAVIFRGGTYRFTQGVSFSADDSGTKDYPITYQSADGEAVFFKGSTSLDISRQALVSDVATLAKLPTSARSRVRCIDLTAQGVTSVGQMPDIANGSANTSAFEGSALYINDKLQPVAHWPNGDDEYAKFISTSGTNTFTVSEDRISNWTNAPYASIAGFLCYEWYYDRIRVANIDADNKKITVADGLTYGLSSSYSRRWSIVNLIEELDTPGEWYIDYDTNLLYYYPLSDTQTLELSTLDQNLINIDSLSNVTFDGFTFSQARGCAIRMTNKSVNVTITNCTFDNIGRYGIYQTTSTVSDFLKGTNQSHQFRENGCEQFVLTNNKFYNCGKMAFELYCGSRTDNIPSGSVVKNNYIYNIGTTDRKSFGASIQGVGIEFANNTIHHTGYGLNFVGSDILIHHNEIYNVMAHMNDGSAIYTGRNFINRGNKIYNNYIHDVSSKDLAMGDGDLIFGIYLDDTDSGTEIYQNIIEGACYGVDINGGMSNSVHDNIFVDTAECIVGIGINPLRNLTTSTEAATTQANSALKLSGYDRFRSEIQADIDSGLVIRPARNTVINNVALNTNVDFDSMMIEHGSTATKYKWYIKNSWSNNFSNNYVATTSDFVNASLGDYRLKSTANVAKTTNVLNDSFDLQSIGAKVQESNLELCSSVQAIYPPAGATKVPTSDVEFSFERPRGADTFRLVVSKDASFNDIVCDATTYETIYTIPSLLPSQTYYWRVYAYNESLLDIPNALSDTYSFKTLADGESPDDSNTISEMLTQLTTVDTFLTIDGEYQLFADFSAELRSGVSYSSDKPGIADVTNDGLIKGISVGTATITVNIANLTRSFIVTVTDDTPTKNGFESDSECSTYARTGTYSHKLSSTEAIFSDLDKLGKNGVFQLWFYDDLGGSGKQYEPADILQIYGYNAGSAVNMWLWLSDTAYNSYNAGKATVQIGTVPRSKGWHQLIIEASNASADVYIDGALITNISYSDTATNALQIIKWFDGSYLDLYIDDIAYATLYADTSSRFDLSGTVNTVIRPNGYTQLLVNGEVPNDIAFSSSNPTIASVNASGIVKGVREGIATITASNGTHQASILIAVTTMGVGSKDFESLGTTDHVRTGTGSLYIPKSDTVSSVDIIYPSISNGVVQFWFYDEATGGKPSDSTAGGSLFNIYRWTADNGASSGYPNYVSKLTLSQTSKYSYGNNMLYANAADNYRKAGWHQYTAYRHDTFIDVYIDGVLMYTQDGIHADSALSGVQWQTYSDIDMWIDDAKYTTFVKNCATETNATKTDEGITAKLKFKKSLVDKQLFVALYSADARLLSVKPVAYSPTGVDVLFSNSESIGASLVKVFVWDSSLSPSCDAEVLFINN